MSNEDWKEGDDVHVDLKYEALPTIPELEFKTVELERMVAKADADSVDEALGNLAASSQNFKDRRKGSKAKDGDQVVFDFVGSVDGEEFEGGSAEDYPLVLGSNSFIPGFEDELNETIKSIIGEHVTVETITRDKALEVPFEGDLVEAMCNALIKEDAVAIPVPYVMSGGTDNKALADLGIIGYGFSPLKLDADFDFTAMFHGVDERVPIEGLTFGARVLKEFLENA